jgi:hypothetical protein
MGTNFSINLFYASFQACGSALLTSGVVVVRETRTMAWTLVNAVTSVTVLENHSNC